MRLSSLIGHLAELLEAVRSSIEPADAVVAQFFRARKYLGARDRRFIADHLFGILRDHRLLEMVARETLGGSWREQPPPDVPPLVLALARVARSVSVVARHGDRCGSLHVDRSQRRGFPGSPSRTCSATRVRLLSRESDAVRRLAIEYSMPDHVVREWVERFGEKETRALCAALNTAAPTTARVEYACGALLMSAAQPWRLRACRCCGMAFSPRRSDSPNGPQSRRSKLSVEGTSRCRMRGVK